MKLTEAEMRMVFQMESTNQNGTVIVLRKFLQTF